MGLAGALMLLAGAAGAEGLPFDLGGPFALVDQYGEARSQADPDGRYQLLFFGYANCREICSAALPLMADVTDRARDSGIEMVPVMITVDPARDTVETLGAPLAQHHPDFIGLTGDDGALGAAYEAFQIETEEVFFDPEYGPVLAHGSFIFLLDGAGEVLTILPPILDPEAMAGIVTSYAEGRG